MGSLLSYSSSTTFTWKQVWYRRSLRTVARPRTATFGPFPMGRFPQRTICGGSVMPCYGRLSRGIVQNMLALLHSVVGRAWREVKRCRDSQISRSACLFVSVSYHDLLRPLRPLATL